MIKVFYDERQTAAKNGSFSPSAGKPKQVVEFWQKHHPIEIATFQPATAEDIAQVHDPEYVQDVLNLKRQNGFGNLSPEVAQALPWVVGSMVSAALHAFTTKESCFSPTSGAHHARYAQGGGFCTFNHLVLAALKAQQAGARKVGIIDLDCHYGDGTDDIIIKLKLRFIRHYTFGAEAPSPGPEAEAWLEALESKLSKMQSCDLLIFNAGVDPHVNDPLGGRLTTEQMFKRDLIVYQFAHKCGIPIATSLAGGYQRDKNGSIQPVLDLHNQTMLAFRKVHQI